MSYRLIDFHCHLDLYQNFEEALTVVEEAKIYTLTVTTTPKTWPRNLELTKRTKYIRAALGFHPQLVDDRMDEIALFEKYFPEARYIGEVGLDAGPNFVKSLDKQKEIFKHILLLCATSGGKILSVHSVRAVTESLNLIEDTMPSNRGQIVLHWYTGNMKEVQKAIELGCYFSINKKMASSNKGKELIKIMPMEKILTETDYPFTNQNNRWTNTEAIIGTINIIAEIKGMDVNEVGETIYTNLRNLLKY